jgi:hypothetical protein
MKKPVEKEEKKKESHLGPKEEEGNPVTKETNSNHDGKKTEGDGN